ncbi:uncharacterized protein si:ch211-159e12.5 [Heptranchias perlo]|uniref:uncharacterized protein si:ch211-159e12.5 n=1 Tax=Heptranchias perlo TaxID=212740 RepID=UPI0035595FF5
MNSEMRNYGNYDSLGKYGTFPGRSTYLEKPFIPHLASVRTERGVNSRRLKEQIPYILQDSTNHWEAQTRNVHSVPRTNLWDSGLSSKATKVKEVNAQKHKRERHWDRGGLEDLGKWESKEKMEKYYKEKIKKQEIKEENMNLGRGWSSPEQVKRPLRNKQKQTRRPLPLLSAPIYGEWEPLYTRDLPQSPPVNQPVDYRPAEIYPSYKEQWTKGHWSHRDASNLSDNSRFSQLKDQSEMRTSLSPNSFEGKGYRERPLKPPSYEMYMQMKKKAEQGNRIAQLENYKRDLQKNYDPPPYVHTQPLSRERKHQGRSDVLGLNVKAAIQARNYDVLDGGRDRNYPLNSELGFKAPQNRFSIINAARPYGSEVSRSEEMGQANQKRNYIDPECFGELLTEQDTRSSYGTWHALDKYLYPGVTQRQKEASLPLYHTSGRSTKGKYKRSDLKHEGLIMQNPNNELDDWPREDDRKNNEGNRMKGEVLRSKKGEVVFCLISRPDTSQSIQDSKGDRARMSHTLPKVGRKSNVPSRSHDLEQSLLAKHERRFYERWNELKGYKSSNKEAVKPQYYVDGNVYSTKNESHSDGMKYGNIYEDIENHGTRNMNYSPNSDHHFCAGNKKAPGSRMREQPYYSDGEEITRWRNSDSTMRKEVSGFDHRSDENSLNYLQVTRQKGRREKELRQWDKGHMKNEMEKTAMFSSNRYRQDESLLDHIEQDRKVSELKWNDHGKSLSLQSQAWDASQESVQRHFYSKCAMEESDDAQNQHRERKLPEWKQPVTQSSVRTGNRFKSEDLKWTTENNGVFVIDATCAIVKAEYISSPKKERVRFSYPIEVEDFKEKTVDSIEHGTHPDSKKVNDWRKKGREISETVDRISPCRKIINTRAGQSYYCGEALSEFNTDRNSKYSIKELEKNEDSFPHVKVKESMKERATRILGLPIMDADSTELQMKEKTKTQAEDKEIEVTGENCMDNYLHPESVKEKRSGPWIDDTVDSLGKSEKIIDSVGWKNVEPTIVGTLQPSDTTQNPLDEVMHNGEIDSGTSDETDIQEGNKKDQEVSGDKCSSLPVEHSSNTENNEDSKYQDLQTFHEPRSDQPPQNLRDMVFESVSRLRRHTAPDSESDDEEVERLLANEVINPERNREENEVLSPGSTDSSTSADTVILCSEAESLKGDSEEHLDTITGENICSECFPPEHEEPENGLSVNGSPQENIQDQNLQELGNTDSWTHRLADPLQEEEGEVFSTGENFLKELSEDQSKRQPGGDDTTNTTHLEPSDGAEHLENVKMALEIKESRRSDLGSSDTEMDRSETASESDVECTGEVH